MKVLFGNFTSDLGGPSHSLMLLLKHLDPRIEPQVLLPGPGPLADRVDALGVPVRMSPTGGFRRNAILPISAMLRGSDVDVVYGNNFGGRMRNLLIASRLAGRRFVWHIREMLYAPGLRTRYFLRHASAIVAVSERCGDLVGRWGGGTPVHVVRNGIEFGGGVALTAAEQRASLRAELGLAPDAPLVLAVGTLNRRKGYDRLVDPVAAIARARPDVRHVWLGSGGDAAYAEELDRLLYERGLADEVMRPGFRVDVPRFLRAADAFVHAARSDPNPRSVIEAMAARLPIVAFEADGVSEMIAHGESGYLLAPGDSDGFATALLRVLGDPGHASGLGASGLSRAKRLYSASCTGAKVSEVLLELDR